MKSEFESFFTVLELRREAMLKGDIELYSFACSIQADKDKHRAHDAIVRWAIDSKLCEGNFESEADRVRIGKWACKYFNKPELADYVQ